MCSFILPETSTTSQTSRGLISRKEAGKSLLLEALRGEKPAQNKLISAKEGQVKILKLLKFSRDINFTRMFWEAWFGYHGGREVFHAGFKDRLFLDDPKQLYDYIEECELLGLPAYISVHPFQERDKVFGLEKLFFDFDCREDLNKAWSEARDFAVKVEKFYGAKPLLVFSGCKGFHVYVWLWKTIQFSKNNERQAKEIYKLLQEKLLKGLNYETCDTQPLGDIKRLARIPYTKHEKTGAFCLPITPEGQPLQILPPAIEGYRNHGLSSQTFQNVAKELQNSKKKSSINITKAILKLSDGKVRPCIEAALETPLDG